MSIRMDKMTVIVSIVKEDEITMLKVYLVEQ